jgi:RNA polymerase sigma factor (sigma-70 family)
MTIPSPPDPDDELLGRIAKQDESAVEWFYKTFVRPVHARLSACGLSYEECEDLIGEVFYEAVRKIDSFDRRKGRFITWLLTIAKRRGIDFQRARRWTKTESGFQPNMVSLDELTERAARQVQSKAPMGEDEETALRRAAIPVSVDMEDRETVEGAIRVSLVQQALDVLKTWLQGRPEEDRIAAEHYLYGTPWADIAARLSQLGKLVSENTAKQRGHRLKEQAKRELAHLFLQVNPAASDTAHENDAPPTRMDGVQ